MAGTTAALVVGAAVGLLGCLLTLLRVADSGSLSFLGVGMLTTLVLLFAIERLDEWSMFLVVPVVSALCFLAAWW